MQTFSFCSLSPPMNLWLLYYQKLQISSKFKQLKRITIKFWSISNGLLAMTYPRITLFVGVNLIILISIFIFSLYTKLFLNPELITEEGESFAINFDFIWFAIHYCILVIAMTCKQFFTLWNIKHKHWQYFCTKCH